MKTELHHATFESKTLLDKRCPADPVHVDSVVSILKNTYMITHDNLHYRDSDVSGQPVTPWPSRNAGERKHYKPFAWLLNTILISARKARKINSIHENLHFFPYDRMMTEGVGGDSPLKPDIIGCYRDVLPDSDQVSWKEAEICVEVKNRWPDMISQASTYARCCFAFQENRRFITIFHFHQGRMEVRVGFYTRSGLIATEAFDISTSAGFRNFVCAVVGIYSWTNPCSAGIDISRTSTRFIIPQSGLYSITEKFCDRRCVRGRATRVYRLKKDGKSMFLQRTHGNRELTASYSQPKLRLMSLHRLPL